MIFNRIRRLSIAQIAAKQLWLFQYWFDRRKTCNINSMRLLVVLLCCTVNPKNFRTWKPKISLSLPSSTFRWLHFLTLNTNGANIIHTHKHRAQYTTEWAFDNVNFVYTTCANLFSVVRLYVIVKDNHWPTNNSRQTLLRKNRRKRKVYVNGWTSKHYGCLMIYM